MGEQVWGDRVYRRARRGRRWATAAAVAVTASTVGVVLDPSAARADAFSVSVTADSGPGSLRQAILDANATLGEDTITFSLAAGSVITPTTPLPAITGKVTINGYSAAGAAVNTNATAFDGVTGVTLDGTAAGPGAVGLDLSATSSSTVRGLRLQRWLDGAAIEAGAFSNIEGNVIQSNLVGVLVPHSEDHVDIGGSTADKRNVIVGNGDGISIAGADHTTIEGNLVGLAADGVTPTPNSTGILVGGDSEEITIGGLSARRNVVSGNARGILVAGIDIHDVEIFNNYVGTTVGGNAAAPNTVTGIELGSTDSEGFAATSSVSNVKIGDGTAGGRNVVAGNTGEGISFWGGVTTTSIRGNHIGVGADGTSALGNNSDAVFGESYGGIVMRNFTTNSTIGGALAGDRNIIANNTGNGVAMFSGSGNRILGNSMYANTLKGINLFGGGGNNGMPTPTIASALLVNGNVLVGYSAGATTEGPVHIEVFEADGDEGRTLLATAELAAAGDGTLAINSAASLGLVAGDSLVLTATDANGNTSEFSAPFVVNTPPPGGPTLIVNSTGDGGDVSPGNGTCSTATAGQCTLRAAIDEANLLGGARIRFAIPSGGEVVTISPLSNYVVTAPIVIDGTTQNGASCASWPPALKVQVTGGTTGALFDSSSAPGQFVLRGLVINGYAQYAVKSMSASITCNLFGTTPDGVTTASTATGGAILAISGTIIGGAGANARNLFAGNEPYHIELTQSANGVYNNYIGTTLDGSAPQGAGVLTSVRLWNLANGNNVGTDLPNAPGNRISGAQRGVSVESNGGANTIRLNEIFGNSVVGIDLGTDGVTFNHQGVQPGPNQFQNYPVVDVATSDGATTRVKGRIDGRGTEAYAVDVFANTTCSASNFGEGQHYLGSFTVTAVGGVATFDQTLPGAIAEPGAVALTATEVSTGNTSEFSYCRPVATPNVTWGTAKTAPTGDSQYITDLFQEKWFKFPVHPGETVKVTLEGLPGSAISLHRDPNPIYNSLLNPSSAAALSAEAADSAFLPSGWLPSGWLPSGWLPSGWLPSTSLDSNALPSGWLPSGWLPSGALPSGWLPSGWLPSTSLPSGWLPSGWLPSGQLATGNLPSGWLPSGSLPSGWLPSGWLPSGWLPSGWLGNGELPPTSNDAYVTAARRSLLGISMDPAAATQTIERSTYDLDEDLYVRIVGPFSLSSKFKLTVVRTGGACLNLTPIADGTPVITGTQPVSASLNTVVVTDTARLAGTGTEKTAALTDLGLLAQRADVKGAVVDLSDTARYPRVAEANRQADASPTCASAKNVVAREIKRVIDAYRAVDPSTMHYVVLAGGANVIPFHQVQDVAGLANEKEYVAPVAPSTPSEAGLRSNLVKGQDFYGSSLTLTVAGRSLALTDLAVGRLVEDAADVSAAVRSYIATGGVVVPRSSVTTGYDFVGDAALDIADEMTQGVGAPSDRLIQPPGQAPTGPDAWTADQLRSKLFGPNNDIVTMTGHFSAGDLLAADYTTTVAASEVLRTTADLTNTIVLALGCHSGFTIPTPDLLAGASPDPDWAKAFLRKGAASFVAATGYAYGDTELKEYGEKLFIELARQMRTGDGPIAMGDALVAAKRAYMSSSAQLTGIDEKTLVEMTLYGLPMMKVNMPGARLPAPATRSIVTNAAGVGNGPGATFGLQGATTNITPAVTKQSKTLADLSPTAGPNAKVTATYYQGRDGVVANPFEPIQPKQIDDVSVTGQVLRGVAFRGGRYTDEAGTLPLTSAPTTEISRAHTSFNSDVFYPLQVWAPNFYDAVNGGATRLVTVPGQFRTDTIGSLDGRGTQRTFSSIDLALYYLPSTWTDANAPATTKAAAVSPAAAILGASASVEGNGSTLRFNVNIQSDGSAGTQAVWVVYTGVPGSPFYGTWAPVDLAKVVGDPTTWTGTLALPPNTPAGAVRFLVQAVNGAGLTSLATNNGAFYSTDPIGGVAPKAATTISLVSPPSSGAFLGPQPLTAVLTSAGQPVANQLVVFDIGGQQSLAVTDATGRATGTISPVVLPGSYLVQASFRGASGLAPSSTSSPFTLTKASTAVTITGTPSDPSTLVAQLRDGTGGALGGKSVVFVATSTTGTVLAVQAVRADGFGDARLGVVALPPGPVTFTAYFNGHIPLVGGRFLDLDDDYYSPSASLPFAATVPDRQAPTITVTATAGGTPYTAGTWTAKDVFVDFTCTDNIAVVSCGPDVTVTAEGVTPPVVGTAVDGSGNTATTSFGPIWIDKSAPTVTITTPVNGATYALGATVLANYGCTDARSGVATCAGPVATGTKIDTTIAGTKTFAVTATDNVGNTVTTSVTYTVAAANQAPVVKADMGVAGLETIGFQSLAVALTGSFTDADGPGPYTAAVRWQAGGTFTPLILNNSSQFLAAFIYPSAGTRVATVRICDAKGNCGTDDVTVVSGVTTKITPVRECVLDRGAGKNPRYQARFGYKNPAAFAIAVPVLPGLENTVSPDPAFRGQPLIFKPGTQGAVFTADFNTGTVSWKLSGVTVSATTSTTPRC